MYFCPCPCDEPPEEPETRAFVPILPRNLSYVQESYIDQYSVSGNFVQNEKTERTIRFQQQQHLARHVTQELEAYLSRDHHYHGQGQGGVSEAAGSPGVTPACPGGVGGVGCAGDSENEGRELLNDCFYSGNELNLVETRAEVFDKSCPLPVFDKSCPLLVEGKTPHDYISCPTNSPTLDSIDTDVYADNGVVTNESCFDQSFQQAYTVISENSNTSLTTVNNSSSSTHEDEGINKDIPSTTLSKEEPDLSSEEIDTQSFPSSSLFGDAHFPGLFTPLAKAASRLSALLSPPNECMNDYRNPGDDIGSSVDGDVLVTKDDYVKCGDYIVLIDEIDNQEVIVNVDQLPPVVNSSVKTEDQPPPVLEDCVEEPDVTLRERLDDEESNVSTDSNGTRLYPNPFGEAGKTFFPRYDLDLSSSDVEMDLHESGRRRVFTLSDTESDDCSQSTTEPITSKYHAGPQSSVVGEEGVSLLNTLGQRAGISLISGSDMALLSNTDDTDSTGRSKTGSETSDDVYTNEDFLCLSSDEENFEEEERHAKGGKKADLPKKEEANSKEQEGKPKEDGAPPKKEMPRKLSLVEALERASKDLDKMALEECEDSRLAQFQTKVCAPDENRSTALSDSPIYADEEFNFNRSKLRKSSSLKTNKTPPGTPHRKKAVRFADAMGLDLESVRHVINNHDPPKIPDSAMADLRDGIQAARKEVGTVFLSPCFSQPGAADNFLTKVMHQKVCLENTVISDLTITGFVRVANVDFNKSVRVRYSHNDWVTFHDIGASYVSNSCDGVTDRFSFSIVAPPYFVPRCRLQFAISYKAGDAEFWDNNSGANYTFECFAKAVPTASETAWMHFI